MKVVVTGGAGFLGSHVADRLLHLRAQVCVIDNYATGRCDNLTTHSNLTVVEGTIADASLVDRVFVEFRPDQVVHAAASYKDPTNWEEDINTNLLGTVNIVRAAQRLNVKRFIYLQTSLCYGKPKEQPITLGHPTQPFTSYAITKTAGEQYLILSGLQFVSLRLANVYGPRHFSGPIPSFYKRLKAGERCTVVDTHRDFLDLQDFMILMDAVMDVGGLTGCFNVSFGKGYSIKEILMSIAKRMKIDLDESVEVFPPGKDDVPSLLLDSTETERAFGWKARIPFDEGIDRLISWYEAHGVEESYTHLQINRR